MYNQEKRKGHTMKFPEKMKVCFRLDRKTTVEDAKENLSTLHKTFDRELMKKHCRYTLSARQYVIIFSLLAIFSIISFTSNYLNIDYVSNIASATSLGDTYAIKEINASLYGFRHILYVFLIIHVVMSLLKYFAVSDFMSDLNKAEKIIEGYVNDESQHKLDENDFEVVQLDFDSDILNLKGRFTTLLSIIFMTVMFAANFGFSSETGSVNEYKGNGELKAIELSGSRPVIYFRENNQLSEIKIPAKVDYKIVFDDAKDAKPRFEYYYRRHGGTGNYKGFILNEKNRTVDYYFNVILPENYNIQGSFK